MLQVYKRRFPISVVKACCQGFYKKTLYPKTWKNWKNIVGIKECSRTISYEEFFRLFEIVNSKKKGKPLFKKDLEDILLKAIEYLDVTETYTGYQLPTVLKENYFIRVSVKQLHEKIFEFALSKTYRIKDVIYLF